MAKARLEPLPKRFDDEGEEYTQEYTLERYDLTDEELAERAKRKLYDPEFDSNVIDEVLEEERYQADDEVKT